MKESVTCTCSPLGRPHSIPDSILNVAVISRVALPVHPWNPSFSSEEAMAQMPRVTRLLGLGLLTLPIWVITWGQDLPLLANRHHWLAGYGLQTCALPICSDRNVSGQSFQPIKLAYCAQDRNWNASRRRIQELRREETRILAAVL